MFRFISVILFIVISHRANAQTLIYNAEYDSIMQQEERYDSAVLKAIQEFNASFSKRDYPKIISLLEEAIQINDTNATTHYYLGYAYSGLNAQESRKYSFPNRNKKLCVKASNEMQKVIALDSNFGAKLTLRPYSKITSEWGSLALRYLYFDKTDSVKWALQQGREKGGFNDFILSYHRVLIDQCDKDAIIFSYGEDSFWNLLYLQYAENYIPKDLSYIDLGLLNTLWYQDLLIKEAKIHFTKPKKNTDNYYLVSYSDTLLTIPIRESNSAYLWSFESHGSNPFYLLYGDIAFRNILFENQFQNPIYFTKGFPIEYTHNLHTNFENQLIIDKFNPFEKSEMKDDDFYKLASKALDLAPQHNKNSKEEKQFIDIIRMGIARRMLYDWSSENNLENARHLMKLIRSKTPSEKYPYQNDRQRIIMDQLKHVIMEDY